MGYRHIEPVMTTINNLCQECRLFTFETDLNNGYGCLSKSKDKNEPGKCYAFDCPLAYTASLKDMKDHDTYVYNEWKNNIKDWHKENNQVYNDNEDHDPDSFGSEWVIQWRETV